MIALFVTKTNAKPTQPAATLRYTGTAYSKNTSATMPGAANMPCSSDSSSDTVTRPAIGNRLR